MILGMHEKLGGINFVQLYLQKESKEIPVFVVDYLETSHPFVLEDALNELGVQYQTRPYSSVPAPLVQGENYRAVGMGCGVISHKERRIVLGDSSFTYGIGPDKEHIEKIIQQDLPGWSFRILS